MGSIIFNGISSEALGIVVQTPPDYKTPERDYDITEVPGRNGDIVIDKGSYRNVDRTYNIAMGAIDGVFVDYASTMSDWLHSCSGYARLEDSYEADYYRLAMFHDELEYTNVWTYAATAKITFDCKPQRFLKSGETAVSLSSGGTLTNPTGFTALPLITLTMNKNEDGVVKVNGYTVGISASSYTTVILDSALQDAYYGTANLNSLITLNSGEFPKLGAGSNTVTFSGGVSAVSITPNWWRL